MLGKLSLLGLLLVILARCVKVDTDTSLFVDEFGRLRIYHGVNVVFKTPPFHPNLEQFSTNHSLTDQDLYNLKHWGMNVIRLHASWEGVQPQKGVYNYTYVETLRQIVRKCNKFGIMVLLDAHQDLFVRQFCGEGLPSWVAQRETFPAPLDLKLRYNQQGYPLWEDCLKVMFVQFYLTFDVMKLQKDLFTNQRGLLDHFCKFWEIIAQNLGKEPNLIGYEFINEPIGFDAYLDPAGTLLPGQVNDKYLLPAYKRLYSAIRKYDKHNPIFFEPSSLDLLGGSFSETPGGDAQLQRQVFSYHIYCPLVTNEGEPIVPWLCRQFDSMQAQLKEENLRTLRIGGFLTEFGALSNSQSSAEEVTIIADLMQQRFRSWTYWQFKYYEDITTMANPGTTESFYDEEEKIQANKVKALARPYAYAVCGRPVRQTLQKGVFSLTWVASDQCTAKKTQLFLSQSIYYPRGKSVAFSNNCKGCSVGLLGGEETNFYEVIVGPESIGLEITVTIAPK